MPSKVYGPEDVDVPGFLPDLPGVRAELANYLNSTRRLDDTFGRVMQALKESGEASNTLVLFITDNGIAVPFASLNNTNDRGPTVNLDLVRRFTPQVFADLRAFKYEKGPFPPLQTLERLQHGAALVTALEDRLRHSWTLESNFFCFQEWERPQPRGRIPWGVRLQRRGFGDPKRR